MSELTDVGAGYENNGGEQQAERKRKIAMVAALFERGLRANEDAYDRAMEKAEAQFLGETMDAQGLIELSLNEYQRRLHTYKPGNYSCHALGLVGELAEVVTELQDAIGPLSMADYSTEQRLRALAAFKAVGAIADRVKKQEFHGCDKADPKDIMKELGDVLWYITAVAGDYGLTLEQVAQANIAKLRARYPNGFEKGGGVRNFTDTGTQAQPVSQSAQSPQSDVPAGPAPSYPADWKWQVIPQGGESMGQTEPKLSYGDALHVIEALYNTGLREFSVDSRVFDAYVGGLMSVTRQHPSAYYKTATVRKGL